MSLGQYSQQIKTETDEQTCPETEAETSIQGTEHGCAKTDAGRKAWVERMLAKSRELNRKYPGRFDHQIEFWDELGIEHMFE